MDDLVEWVRALRVKILAMVPNWKPTCFIIDETPQELRALW
jgi:hypothetical protein